MWNEDRAFIARKYADPDLFYRETQGLDPLATCEAAAAFIRKRQDQPHGIIKAETFGFLLQNAGISVDDRDWFFHFSEWRPQGRRTMKSLTVERWKEALFQGELADNARRMREINESGMLMMWPDYDHSAVNFEVLFELGFPGMLKRARVYRSLHEASEAWGEDKRVFFDALEIEYQALLAFLDRVAEYAEQAQGPRCAAMAKALRKLRTGVPETTYEALLFIWTYFLLSEYVDAIQVRTFGNLDRILYPFYCRDLETGRFDKAQIREFFRYFMEQASAMNHYWGHPFYFGGTRADGESEINALSYLILDEYDRMGIYDPKLQIKLSPNTPQAFVDKALDMIRRGHNSIVFVNEPATIQRMIRKGMDRYERARAFCVTGCYETCLLDGGVGTAAIHLNMEKAVELVFYRGRDKKTGHFVGSDTGPLEALTTFDAFYKAFLAQIDASMEEGIRIVDGYEARASQINPSPLLNGAFLPCLVRARDAFGGGGEENPTTILICNTASAADSLHMVSKYVYDKQALSLSELKAALDAEWAGFEALRQRLRADREKYGNNLEDPDSLARNIAHWVSDRYAGRTNARGGVYETGLHCAKQFLDMAPKTGATPDGRRRGDELSKNMSPAPGACHAGPTALIQSMTKLDFEKFPADFPLDVMLHPSAVAGADGLTALRGLLMTYLKRGGISIHFNVFDAAVLHSAQEHPEKYAELQVRVCGWNVLWNNLTRAEQDQYIVQAEAMGR